MDDGNGALPMELQAQSIADNLSSYRGATCPDCGQGGVNPVEVIYNNGRHSVCREARAARRIQERLA